MASTLLGFSQRQWKKRCAGLQLTSTMEKHDLTDAGPLLTVYLSRLLQMGPLLAPEASEASKGFFIQKLFLRRVIGYCFAIGVIHTGVKSRCELVTLVTIGGYCCPLLAVGVIHTGPKFGCKLVTLFSSYSL